MQIGGLQKLTLIDYPGKLAATVFLLGCPYRCPWCYNSELVLPEKIKSQPRISEKEFFEFLKGRKDFLEGVCLGGGEPTFNENLPQFCKKIKNLRYAVKLDTNGSNPQMLKILIEKKLIDYVAMDIKAPTGVKTQSHNLKLKNKYEQAIGIRVNLVNIQRSIEIIKNSDVGYEFRTTVVSSIHTKEDIIQIAKEISPAKKYYLQNFQPEKTINPKFEKIKPYSNEEMLKIQQAIAPFFEVCGLR